MTSPITAEKNILGYTLKERIGSGGYGEVWSAVAPGGIMKALKVVYGFHNEKHATQELKALDRVKQLRHPFLLSLERIEVHEGQLIVVTELADKSLADNFNEYIVKDEPGIPRDLLIKYMRNTAEALDYMSREHGLQHLDIKPENLLMVGGHLKVADFGLAKDLQNTAQSLMSGMTPAYAAPELFDGQPGSNSDQYSLAIVYQEMLTGVRPFPGTTPAQLAAQHMHGKPNLRPLDKHDQVVLLKALAKDPQHRFASCLEMIEELANKKRAVKKAIRRTQTVREFSDTEAQTSCFPTGTAVISDSSLPFHASDIEMLDAPDCDPENATFRPTLIVGVGATANRIVQKTKALLANRHGSIDLLPSVKVLCIDTDRQELCKIQQEPGSGQIDTQEVIETALRKPESYRNRDRDHLRWLGRRWIYNIPRSLQTEGLRPLGRLALADHFEPICDRLQDAISEITKEEHLGTTADSLEMNPGSTNPRVILISSISGGVGSGMSIDLAYTIKLLLHESGLPSECVTGLFTHSTYQRNRDPGLSAANALAFLTELRHFTENGFPGDETIGLPAFDDEQPVDFPYFSDIGHDLSLSKFEEKLDGIAEYVYLSSFSKSSEFFDQCRSLEGEIDHLALRTFGLSATGPGTGESNSQAVKLVRRSLLRKWTHGDASYDFDPTAFVNSAFEESRLTPDRVTQDASKLAESVFDSAFDKVADSFIDVSLSHNSEYVKHLSALLDGILGTDQEAMPESVLQMEESVDRNASDAGLALRNGILEILAGKSMNLHYANESAKTALEILKRHRDQIRYRITEREQDIAGQAKYIEELELEILSTPTPGKYDDELKASLKEYCNRRLLCFVNNFVARYFASMVNSVESLQVLLRQYGDQLHSVVANFDDKDELEPLLDSTGLDIGAMMCQAVAQDTTKRVEKTELQVYESLVKDCGGYIGLLNQTEKVRDELGKTIAISARRVVANSNRNISIDEIIVENAVASDSLAKWLNKKLAEAQPQVRQCGGSARLMIGVPGQSENSFVPNAIEKLFGLSGSKFYGTNGCFILCFEGEDVPLANVAFRLLESRPDAIELVKRIHTRKDVDWTSLNDLL